MNDIEVFPIPDFRAENSILTFGIGDCNETDPSMLYNDWMNIFISDISRDKYKK